MERLTYDFALGGNHCWQVKGADNLECREVCERQGDDGCKTCPIAKTFDRLAAYEDTGLEPEEIELLAKQRDLYVDACGELPLKRIRELAQADREGRCFIGPFVAMIEQSLSGGEMKPQRDQRFNGRYAVVYFDPKKWSFPLIDICGTPYNREEAEERMKVLEAALRREQDEQTKP